MLLLYSNDQEMFSFTFCKSNASILSNLVKKKSYKIRTHYVTAYLVEEGFLVGSIKGR